MSAPNDGGPAFPRAGAEHSLGGNFEQDGMTLRDWFAGQAITGMTSQSERKVNDVKSYAKIFAKDAYTFADAMIAARNNLP